MDEDALRRQIANNIVFLPAKLFMLGVLGSDLVQKIDFTTPAGAVTQSTFKKVRDSIAIDKIVVMVMDANDPDASIGGAVYLPGPNVMKLPPMNEKRKIDLRPTVVHESVHAALDIDNPNKPTTNLYAEANAYIAEAIFLRMVNSSEESPSRRPPSFIHHEDWTLDEILKAAWAIAVKCVDGKKSKFAENDAEWRDLLNAIMNAPLYINFEPFWEIVNSDGV